MMKKAQSKTITGGVYLVLDPAVEKSELFQKLEQALQGGVDVVQIWNNWPDSFSVNDKQGLVNEILEITSPYELPVLINEEWELLKATELDGVHFDEIPAELPSIKKEIGRSFITGITCGNDLDVIRRAEELEVDYLSFCAMFPSTSVSDCEIVRPDTVRKAREITQKPLFVSGGITPENLPKLQNLNIEGVAVISGILNSGSPKNASRAYKKALQNLNKKEV